ncbi:MAG: hypothetical protein GQ569_07435 [Methylococcaceae bacterium]|nr:hypothetical protein [Methylococcaceae bacterium]
MAEKDIISKQSIKRIAVDIAIHLLHLEIDPNDVELLTTEQQRVEDRRADLVVKLKLKNKQPFILHIEIQSSNDKKMPLRMMRYYTDIALAYPKFPIKQYVIYIGKRTLNMDDFVKDSDWSYRYQLIDMKDVDCRTLMARNNPDALVLAILCDFKGRDEQEMVNHIMLSLYELLEDEPKRFREYVGMLDVLAENRDLQIQIKEAGKMITQINIEKSGLYQLGEERGEERGEKRGAISTLQNSIVSILSTRFQQIPELVKNKLSGIKNIEVLNQLLIKAISINKAENLFDD